MLNWIILTNKKNPISADETPHRVVDTRQYLATPDLVKAPHAKIINLATSYSYQSRGYYASLLAGARGHKILPSIETMVDLSDRKLYENSIPELEDSLNKCLNGEAATAPESIKVFFGKSRDNRFERFCKLLFDWFRAPAVEVVIEQGNWASIKKIQLLTFPKIPAEERHEFMAAMDAYSSRQWRDARQKTVLKYSIATLCNAEEAMPPSNMTTLKHWARIAEKMGVEVEPITRRDLAKVANYDALFIRETTSIANHTYRFARRAQQEGMPVIDDPISMIRCTNKVYLHELMGSAKIAMPPSHIISSINELPEAADKIGFPIVVKTPDGSFSRGVKKADNMADLKELVASWLKDTDLLITQKFMPTEFDWRIGVLDGKPLFVSQYTMAKKHWQIVKHQEGKKSLEGNFNAVALADCPAELLKMATDATRMIGDGLYGVDIKQTTDGYFLIEVNDNPNVEHGIEDFNEKDEIWTRLTQWFIDRIDA
jgi:glutathione synthase/RimK-type ligase-like ATP-grasp enzyme